MRHFLLIASLLAIGCTSQPKELLSDLEKDFPTADTINSELLNQFELYSDPLSFIVKDSLLFVYERTSDHFGRCLGINSGNELAKVVNKGNASFEMIFADRFRLYNDSIEVLSFNSPRIIKLFSINDMLNGKVPNPRAIALPDSISSFHYELIDSHTIIGLSTSRDDNINHKYFIVNPNELFKVGEINKELFTSTSDLSNRDMRTSSSGMMRRNQDKIAYVSLNGLHIELIDLRKKIVQTSRYYYKIEIDIKDHGNGATSMSSKSEFRTFDIKCNDENIFIVGRYWAPETSGKKTYDCVLVFDWDLNPVRKYYLKPFLYTDAYISEDCRFVYSLSPVDDYFALYRYKL